MTSIVDIREQLRAFIAERFLFDAAAAIDPGISLIENGILDSTGAMELVLFLESTFGIRVNDVELVPDNLDGINKLAAFIERKQAVQAA
jgi:acyl carrier protein